MFHDHDHPDVPLADWQAFQKQFSPHLFSAVLDRDEIELPDFFAPLARGAAIPSDYLLRRVGYRPGSRRPPYWEKSDAGYVFNQYLTHNYLKVRRCGNRDLWTVERWSEYRPYLSSDEVLVSKFGSTPILAPNYQSAMRLAEYCHQNEPPSGLRWIAACPPRFEMAIGAARQRRMNETPVQTKLS
jgi:hypothetical protein